MSIPKIIHYCWFGNNPLPESALQCIESWKKFCPDYKIIEWNEKNYDINKCRYVKEAYTEGKYAFVSDYARFDILYNYGGIYFDTDVELIRNINHIVSKGAFMGREAYSEINEKLNIGNVATGLGIAAPKNFEFYKKILESYENDSFIRKNGCLNLKTVVHRVSELLPPIDYKSKEIINVEGINIYPSEYFCPLDYYTGELNITDNTVSIHHYAASWHDKLDKKIMDIEKKVKNLLGEKVGMVIIPIITLHLKVYRRWKRISKRWIA